MPTDSSKDLAITAITMLANDPNLHKVQVERLLRMAFEDGVLDDVERGILTQVFNQVEQSAVSPEAWDLISITRFRYKL